MAPVPPPLPVSSSALPDTYSSDSGAATPSTSPYAAIAAVTAMDELSPMAVGTAATERGGDRKKDEYFEL